MGDEVAISNALSFYMLNFTFLNQIYFGNSDRAAYSDLKPLDGGQSLYPMSTVFIFEKFNLPPSDAGWPVGAKTRLMAISTSFRTRLTSHWLTSTLAITP